MTPERRRHWKNERSKERYQENRQVVLDRQKSIRVARAEVIRAAKDRPCTDCGVAYPYYVMDFDHVRDKKAGTISQMKCSIPVLLAEIAKCDVVCANCHRERTHG